MDIIPHFIHLTPRNMSNLIPHIIPCFSLCYST